MLLKIHIYLAQTPAYILRENLMPTMSFLQIAKGPIFSSPLWLQFHALTEFLFSALHNSVPSSPNPVLSPKSNHFFKHCTLVEFLLMVCRS